MKSFDENVNGPLKARPYSRKKEMHHAGFRKCVCSFTNRRAETSFTVLVWFRAERVDLA
jgi:hypothetical protein